MVVYKIDRLSRSLIDFASLLGRFEAHGVDFIAVTQAFNTTSSMGRLTLNILLSFAQFERELVSERLRDKFAAVRAQGLWQTGLRPFGYRVDNGVLTVDEAEAEVIRHMHRRYDLLGSARLIARELTARGVCNKAGKPFSARSVRGILANRLYCGDLVHGGQPIPGKHRAIISEARWLATQRAIAAVLRRHRPPARPHVPNPLKGRIFGPNGELLSLDFVYNQQGRIYRYYTPSGRRPRRAFDNPNTRFRADVFDETVLSAILDFVPLAARATARESRSKLLKTLVQRVDIGQEKLAVALRSGAFVQVSVAGRVRAINKPRGPRPPKPGHAGETAVTA